MMKDFNSFDVNLDKLANANNLMESEDISFKKPRCIYFQDDWYNEK